MFSEYKLYVAGDTYDDYGNKQEGYKFVSTIDAALAIKTVNVVINEQVYQKNILMGVTPYSSFTRGKQYKLTKDNREYIVNAFILGRLCSLQLTEVV